MLHELTLTEAITRSLADRNNGSTTASVPARVSKRIHGHFGSQGASEFLGRTESEAETCEERRASIRTFNWYDICHLH